MNDGYFGGGSFGSVNDYYEYESTSSGPGGGGGGKRPNKKKPPKKSESDKRAERRVIGCIVLGILSLYVIAALLRMLSELLAR